ncbi:MAG: ECF-type sigma factor [Arenicellales bacterium]
MNANDIDTQAYQALKKMAARYMSNERVNHTLCPTALVNEAYLKLYGRDSSVEAVFPEKMNFMAVAARSMRQILVDHALAKKALKRGGGQKTMIIMEDQMSNPTIDVDILHLNAALNKLAEVDETKAKIVELRYFSGMTLAEVAQELGLSIATIKRKWTAARAWLYREMA